MVSYLFALMMVFIAYLLGSISSAVLIAKWMKLPDPRTSGSGNPGATNILRVGGKTAGAITLAGDVLKGWLPVVIARAGDFSETVIALTALAAFLGHLYPLYFNFKGGKGVATGFGVLLAMSPLLGLLLALVWGLLFSFLRYSSLAALSAVTVGIACGWGLLSPIEYLVAIIIGLFVFWRHRDNIKRLIQGTENK